jgi:hypothetical protein
MYVTPQQPPIVETLDLYTTFVGGVLVLIFLIGSALIKRKGWLLLGTGTLFALSMICVSLASLSVCPYRPTDVPAHLWVVLHGHSAAVHGERHLAAILQLTAVLTAVIQILRSKADRAVYGRPRRPRPSPGW